MLARGPIAQLGAGSPPKRPRPHRLPHGSQAQTESAQNPLCPFPPPRRPTLERETQQKKGMKPYELTRSSRTAENGEERSNSAHSAAERPAYPSTLPKGDMCHPSTMPTHQPTFNTLHFTSVTCTLQHSYPHTSQMSPEARLAQGSLLPGFPKSVPPSSQPTFTNTLDEQLQSFSPYAHPSL